MTYIEGLSVSVEHVAYEVAKLQLARIAVDQAIELAAPMSSSAAIDAMATVVRPGQNLAGDVGFSATVLRRAAEVLPISDPQDLPERNSRNEKFASFIRDHMLLSENARFPMVENPPLKYRQRLISDSVASSAALRLGVAERRGSRLRWLLSSTAAAQYFEADARQGSTLLIAQKSEDIRGMSKEWLRLIEPKIRYVGGRATTVYTEIGDMDPTEKVALGRRKQKMFPIEHFWKRFTLNAEEMKRLMRIKLRSGS